MKTTTLKWIVALAGVLTLGWGCSSDDDGGHGDSSPTPEAITYAEAITYTAANGQPDWQIDLTWHDQQPDWQNPHSSRYEERMYVTLKLHPAFVPHSTDDDRMAIFIGDECRGVGQRNVSELDPTAILFPIMVQGRREDSEQDQRLTVQYYCGGAGHIFTAPGFYGFMPDAILGDTWDLLFPFDGGKRYATYKMVKVQLQGNVPFTTSTNDLVAAFIDGECRGTGTCGNDFHLWLTSSEEEGRTFQLRYYSEEAAGIYTLQEPIQLTEENFYDITFNF